MIPTVKNTYNFKQLILHCLITIAYVIFWRCDKDGTLLLPIILLIKRLITTTYHTHDWYILFLLHFIVSPLSSSPSMFKFVFGRIKNKAEHKLFRITIFFLVSDPFFRCCRLCLNIRCPYYFCHGEAMMLWSTVYGIIAMPRTGTPLSKTNAMLLMRMLTDFLLFVSSKLL